MLHCMETNFPVSCPAGVGLCDLEQINPITLISASVKWVIELNDIL